ncbi:MAG: hypothetical protein AAFU85_10640 [Planctomycetota bacterium]
MSNALDVVSAPTADTTDSSHSTWRPLEAALITDYNWGTGALLAYVGVHFAPAFLPVDIRSLPMRIAASFAGWICVLFLTRTAFRVMPIWIAVPAALAMMAALTYAWLFIAIILMVATSDIRKAGYKFGIFANAKPPTAAISQPNLIA